MKHLLLLGSGLACLTSGCGHLNFTAVPAAAAVRPLNAPARPPADLLTAERQGRAALSLGADQRLVLALLGTFDALGQPQGGVDAHIIVRFASPAGAKAALLTAYFDFQNQPTLFSGSVSYHSGVGIGITLDGHYPATAIPPLNPVKLPAPARAVALAQKAGLAGDSFMVEYKALLTGPELAVSSWGLADANEKRQLDVRVFDALTLAPVPVVTTDDPLATAADSGT